MADMARSLMLVTRGYLPTSKIMNNRGKNNQAIIMCFSYHKTHLSVYGQKEILPTGKFSIHNMFKVLHGQITFLHIKKGRPSRSAFSPFIN